MSASGRISDLLGDPRAVTLAIVGVATAALWWMMFSMGPMAMPAGWSAGLVGATALMWVLMMLAMMLPAMAPVVSIYAGLAAKEHSGIALALRILVFFLGYFVLWAVIAVAMALLQLGLRESTLFTMTGTQATPIAAAILLLMAGAYQLTSVKDACLKHCRSPLAFLLSHWREGLRGALPMGARHGLYCVGCCIAIMGLMFVFGAMNPIWMAAITAYFVAEKLVPAAERWSRWVGYALIIGGLGVLLSASRAQAEDVSAPKDNLAYCGSQASALRWFYQGAVNDGVAGAESDLESLQYMQDAYIDAITQVGGATVETFKSMTKTSIENLADRMQESEERGSLTLFELRANVLSCAEIFFEKS